MTCFWNVGTPKGPSDEIAAHDIDLPALSINVSSGKSIIVREGYCEP